MLSTSDWTCIMKEILLRKKNSLFSTIPINHLANRSLLYPMQLEASRDIESNNNKNSEIQRVACNSRDELALSMGSINQEIDSVNKNYSNRHRTVKKRYFRNIVSEQLVQAIELIGIEIFLHSESMQTETSPSIAMDRILRNAI